MKRTAFTYRVALLIQYVPLICGCRPILDYCKRSDHEQAWLCAKKLSKCDGKGKISDHQWGMAIDLYLEKNGKLVWDRRIYRKLHKFWELLGGKPMISWDIAHFGMKRG